MTADKTLVLSSEEIGQKVALLGTRISDDFSGKELILVGVLNGSFIFLADLARSLSIPHQVDFIRVASYGSSDSSSGTITLTKDIELDVAGKHILLVEDIIDTGSTLKWLTGHFNAMQAASVSICTLIDKKERRKTAVAIDYVGFSLEKGFLVGYGLDYAEQYRSLPAVYSLRI